MTARGAQDWIDALNLQPHPEGGFFAETYRSSLNISSRDLGGSFNGSRSASTAIYFLLRAGDISHFHKIASDELWHFYAGDALDVHIITETGDHEVFKLGSNPENGEQFQACVPAGLWFGSCVADGGSYALVGCTVAPGFDFEDFEMAERAALVKKHPRHKEIIHRLTL